jgi:pimeloyl-ACP methyl ester carboxylesterase
MDTISTKDGVDIFYKDWGPKDAQPLVFHHGWPLSADDWDTQMLYFLGKGYRVVAHDRRGHGRSSQVSDGHDMDHYAAFAGHEQALMRVIGLTVAVIGWLYFFGGRSGARQFIAASVIDRLTFVPAVLIPLWIAGVFPRLFLTFTILMHCWQSARGCCLIASESPLRFNVMPSPSRFEQAHGD